MQMEQLQIYSGFNYEMKEENEENGFVSLFRPFFLSGKRDEKRKKIRNISLEGLCLIKEQEISIYAFTSFLSSNIAEL
jgi:hypothetical protein